MLLLPKVFPIKLLFLEIKLIPQILLSTEQQCQAQLLILTAGLTAIPLGKTILFLTK